MVQGEGGGEAVQGDMNPSTLHRGVEEQGEEEVGGWQGGQAGGHARVPFLLLSMKLQVNFPGIAQTKVFIIIKELNLFCKTREQ